MLTSYKDRSSGDNLLSAKEAAHKISNSYKKWLGQFPVQANSFYIELCGGGL